MIIISELNGKSKEGDTEGELKKYQELPKDELAVKVLNILYNEEIGISFGFLHAPNSEVVENHHEKLRVKRNWITEVKTTA